MSVARVLEAIAGAAGSASTAVIGAVARNAWAPPRATTDLDLAIAASAEVLQAVEGALGRLGFRCVRRQQAEPGDPLPDLLVFRRDEPELRQVDLLVAKTEFERQALARAVPLDVAGAGVRVAAPEDLIVYKLLAFRPRDRDDMRQVARTRARAGRPIDWAHVARWAADWGVEDRLATLRAEIDA